LPIYQPEWELAPEIAVKPKNLAHGIIFFPGEASSAKQLRLQLIEVDTGKIHLLKFRL